MWIDNNTIKVISTEGIEKIIDISKDFKEIASAVIPLFIQEKCADFDHYYF